MPEHQLLLPDEIYSHLLAVAQAEGISPIEWITTKLPSISEPRQSDSNSFGNVSDLIGAINSQEQPLQTYQKTSFGEALALKLAKQYIKRP
jgi:hypothetical protein